MSLFSSGITTEQDAYWLGFLAADGCITTTKGWKGELRLILDLSAVDEGHVRNFAALVGSKVYGPYPNKINGIPTGKFHFSVTSRNQKIVEALISNGVTPRKSLTLNPWSGPQYLVRHYWRGMLDGDGWISLNNKGGAEVGLVGTEAVARAFSNYLVSEIGLPAAGVYRNKSVWRCQVGGVTVPKKVVRHFYEGAGAFLPRKKALADLVLGLEEKNGYYEDLTAEQLTQLYQEKGTWGEVANHLNTNKGTVRHHRKRLGLGLQKNPYEDLTSEKLAHLYQELGTWNLVAEALGTNKTTIRNHRRRLGILAAKPQPLT